MHENAKVWRSCCFNLDSHCVAYTGQFIFTMSVLGFCSVMLVKANGSCEQSSSYINIISFMMGKYYHLWCRQLEKNNMILFYIMGICQSNDTYYDEFVYDIEMTPLKYMNLIDRQDIKRKLRMKKLNQREYDIYQI